MGHQLLKGEVLVRVSLDRCPANTAKQVTEPRVAREVAAHDKRVDEEPDQAL